MSLAENYFMIASCQVQKGGSIYFWNDLWDIEVPKWKYEQLCSFSRSSSLSVKQFLD